MQIMSTLKFGEQEAGEELMSAALYVEEGQEEDEVCHKIFDDPLRKYFEVATDKGVNHRCFQCFSDKHRVTECKKTHCRFCGKKSSVCRHYSLICGKAPRNLTTFLGVRDSVVEKRTNVMKIADDFRDFTFQDSDFSDVE